MANSQAATIDLIAGCCARIEAVCAGLDAIAGEATLHLRASPGVFLRVGSGRRQPAEAIACGAVHVDGDPGLAAAVLAALNVVP
jgi:putative sterol carrier protein